MSVPSSESGPHPFPPLHPGTKGGGGYTRLRVRGWGGSQIGRLEKKPISLSTLWLAYLAIYLTEVPLPAWQTLDPAILADVMILSWEQREASFFHTYKRKVKQLQNITLELIGNVYVL